jgi:hypothetical protein
MRCQQQIHLISEKQLQKSYGSYDNRNNGEYMKKLSISLVGEAVPLDDVIQGDIADYPADTHHYDIDGSGIKKGRYNRYNDK